MIDLETLDTAPSSIILEMGLVTFEMNSSLYSPTILTPSIKAQLISGRTQSDETLDWWRTQSQRTDRSVATQLYIKDLLNGTPPETHSPEKIYDTLRDTIAEVTGSIWCKGASFDFPIIRSYFQTYGLRDPIPYHKQMCLRTAINLAKSQGMVPEKRGTTSHTAHGDCLTQIEQVRELWRFWRM